MRAGIAALLIVAGLAACSETEPTRPIHPASARANVAGTIVVTNTNDAGAGSLRQALATASVGATIQFDPSLSGKTIVLVSPLATAYDVTIEGPAGGITLDGNKLTGIVQVQGGTLTLKRLTLTRAANGSAIFADVGSVVVDHSAIIGNDVGLVTGETATVTNSTFSGNNIAVHENSGDLRLIHTTIANNFEFGLRVVDADVLFVNSIITNNLTDCLETVHATISYVSLLSETGCFGFGKTPGINLLPLADNGGPTRTHALAPTSAAIDAGGCDLADDQRGVPRPQFYGCDAGAYEFEDVLSLPITVGTSPTLDPNTGAIVISGALRCPVAPTTLRFKVTLAQAQKVKGASIEPKSSADVAVNCPQTNVWIVSIPAPANATFVTGRATVTTQILDAPSFIQSPVVATEVRIVQAKK